jgi:hypothetical protein
VDIPRPHVAGFVPPSTWQLTGPTLADVSPGVQTDGTTTASELVGHRGLLLLVATSAQPPDQPGWSLLSPVIPLGQNVTITAPATGTHVAYALVFDSGFQTEHLQKDLHLDASICHPTDQDGDGYNDLFGDPECCPDPAACDCNDLDSSIHPGAVEVCNNKDDDCDSVVDNVSRPGPIFPLALGKAPGTTRLSWPRLVVATSYDVVRGNLGVLLDSGFRFSVDKCFANGLDRTPSTMGQALPRQSFYISCVPPTVPGSERTTTCSKRRTRRGPQIAASPQACPKGRRGESPRRSSESFELLTRSTRDGMNAPYGDRRRISIPWPAGPPSSSAAGFDDHRRGPCADGARSRSAGGCASSRPWPLGLLGIAVSWLFWEDRDLGLNVPVGWAWTSPTSCSGSSATRAR